jgi:hypothetical protein
LSSFDHETFEEVDTVAYALLGGILEFETEPKAYTNVANRIV